MVRLVRLALCAALPAMCLPKASAALPSYSVTDLGPARGPSDTFIDAPGSGAQRTAYINDLGDVVFATTTGDLSVYRANLNAVTTVTRNWWMQPAWFNNRGEAGGYAGTYNKSPSPPATKWQLDPSGNMIWSPDHEGPINDNGLQCTTGPNGRALYDRATGTYDYFNYERTQWVLDLFNINAAGDVAGEAGYMGAPVHACVIRQHGALEDLGTLGGRISTAEAINNLGDTAGWSSTADGFAHPFLCVAGQPMQDLQGLGVDSGLNPSFAFGINDYRAVVGTATAPKAVGGLARDAFIYTPEAGMLDLNDLVVMPAGSRLRVASGINNRGQIAAFTGFGTNARLMLLTPTNSVPEPGTVVLLATGSAGAGALRFRKKPLG